MNTNASCGPGTNEFYRLGYCHQADIRPRGRSCLLLFPVFLARMHWMNEILAAAGGLIVGFLAAFLLRSSRTTAPPAAAPTAPAPPPTKPTDPPTPVRNDAVSLLAALQREARFIDIVKEPLGDYTDAQVGAAARDVLRDCGTVLDRMFQIEPVVNQPEGASVDIPEDARPGQFRITGQGDNEAKSGALVHHGWKATRCQLPTWTGDKQSAMIVAPAELEV